MARRVGRSYLRLAEGGAGRVLLLRQRRGGLRGPGRPKAQADDDGGMRRCRYRTRTWRRSSRRSRTFWRSRAITGSGSGPTGTPRAPWAVTREAAEMVEQDEDLTRLSDIDEDLAGTIREKKLGPDPPEPDADTFRERFGGERET